MLAFDDSQISGLPRAQPVAASAPRWLPWRSVMRTGPVVGCTVTCADTSDQSETKSEKSATERIVSISRWDGGTQSWQTHIPGAPAAVNSLRTLSRLDVLLARLETDAPFGFLVIVEPPPE